MTLDLDKLEWIAKAARKGPWHVDEDPRDGMEWNRHICADGAVTICFMTHSGGDDPDTDEATAKHVATFDPPTVLAMIDELRTRRGDGEAMSAAMVYVCPKKDAAVSKPCQPCDCGLPKPTCEHCGAEKTTYYELCPKCSRFGTTPG